MAFTAKLGISDSYPGNVPPGFGASALPYKLFSGLYTLQAGKMTDTLFLSITYPSYVSIDVAIPAPFIESAPFSEGDEQ